MTRKEACEIEQSCNELISACVGDYCRVSLALTGKLKIEFGDDTITLSKDLTGVDWVNYTGYYDRLNDIIDKIITCVRDNKDLFNTLIWSYEHIRELEEE